MQNMPRAAFSIVNYYFDKVTLDLENMVNKELNLSFKPQGTFNTINSEFELQFTLDVCAKDFDKPFITVSCRGFFKFDNEQEKSTIPDFFYNNCIAILFPYLRAYVGIITTQANIPGIILPTLNLSSLGEELKKNTSEK